MKSSPTCSVPLCTSTVATGPLPGSSCASTTVPWRAVRVRLEIEDLGLQQDLLEQLVDAGALLGRDLRAERGAAELLEHDAVLQQVLLHLLHVRLRQIDLVDRDDHRHAGVLGVGDRLDRLRHDLVVGGDHEHDDVRHLRAARAHGGERLVARRVEEGDRLAAGQRDVVRADVLRDAAGLARHDVRLADVVEQRRLAVIDVTHDGDDRRPRHEILAARRRRRCRLVLGLVLVLAHRLEAELGGDQLDLVEVEALVDRDHQPEVLEGEPDDLGGRTFRICGELGHRDELVDADERLLALDLGRALRLDLLAI